MKLAIIGGGPAGLGVLKEANNDQNFECTLFEQSGKIGGLWNYSENVDMDDNGVPIHSAIYQGMTTNVPKETMAFDGFPFTEPEHTFVDYKIVLEYIKNFSNHFNLERFIKFYTQVILVEPTKNGKWLVRTKNVRSRHIEDNLFDAVAVCNGHFFKPYIPKIPGQDLITSKSIHSREYRSPEKFKGKIILIVGAGRSGTDISRLLAPEAKQVIVSFTGEPFCAIDKRAIPKFSHIVQFTESKAIFEDKSEEFIDHVIYCTGYITAFPFLSPKCNITVEENWVKPLYKHLINIEHPTMAFINITDFTLTFPLCALQARFFLALLRNKFSKTKEEMVESYNEEIRERDIQKIPMKYTHILGAVKMEEYCKDLSTLAGVRNIPNVINEIHKYRFSLKPDSKIKVINENEFSVL